MLFGLHSFFNFIQYFFTSDVAGRGKVYERRFVSPTNFAAGERKLGAVITERRELSGDDW